VVWMIFYFNHLIINELFYIFGRVWVGGSPCHPLVGCDLKMKFSGVVFAS